MKYMIQWRIACRVSHGVRGLKWPVVNGKETQWRFIEGHDPYDKDQVFGAYGMDYMHASRTAMNMTIPSGRAEDGQAQPASSHDLPTDENYDQMQSCAGLDDSQGQWSFADDDEAAAEPAPVEVDYGMPDGVIDGRCRGSSGDSPSLQAGVRAHSEDLGGWRWTSDGNC